MKLVKLTNGPESATKRWYDDACGTALGMELVGERWSLLIVRELLLGPRRFGALRAGLPGISANVLTQRLEGLEASGIIERRTLPPPANVQVYALTPWGEECEPVVLGLARWALRSPMHDPRLSFSPTALMLSLKMLVVTERLGDMQSVIGLRLDGEDYVARVGDGAITVARGAAIDADAMLAGAPGAMLPLFFGGKSLAEAEAAGLVSVSGDRARAALFATLFSLPQKAR
ncbi:winged helix-turn-helix transcriptional regulator [Sphingomonas sp. AR_OL41]|jgi:DNA-binding HxlR family transcriptional regulator|uniref:winged helix-turn-helix transcriptional regulator n=1 Tax=Sphingomonas sp. AR_OL41 TaxID=3042729 RepID=UPI00247FD161|nr:winged helix-turn-helix transcriptional regulator [Sphingomonas sp. AR_OL41]MDH7973507.1 winged helix-turn-helix transcriptional regulator [Sphingomonas sp. AR_OL41]